MPPERGGLSRERTALGWQRSALSLAAIAAILCVVALHRGEPLAAVAAIVPAAAAVAVRLRGDALYAQRTRGDAREAPGSLLALALATVAVALVAAVVVAGGA
jgi:uncharacterized membrane protein YidH (DUF202 family)